MKRTKHTAEQIIRKLKTAERPADSERVIVNGPLATRITLTEQPDHHQLTALFFEMTACLAFIIN
jgi:hypothetical protein